MTPELKRQRDLRRALSFLFFSILLLLLQVQLAFAENIPLSDLYGYSLTAEWSIDTMETCSSCGVEQQPFALTKTFVEEIYVSSKGRIFHNRNTLVNDRQWNNFSMITTNITQELIYDPMRGFVSRIIPSDYNKNNTTFVRIAIVTVTRSGSGFNCSVSTRLILKVGQKEYVYFGLVRHNPNRPTVNHILSFGLQRSSCSVSQGNIFLK